MLKNVDDLKIYLDNNNEKIEDISICNPLANKLLTDINNITEPIKNCLWGPEEGIKPYYIWDYI